MVDPLVLDVCPKCGTFHDRESGLYLGHNTLQDGKTYAIAKCPNCEIVWGIETCKVKLMLHEFEG